MADNSMTNSTTEPNTADSREEDLDASIEADISQEPLNQDSMDVDAKVEGLNAASSTVAAEIPAMTDPRIPAKKDASLREFLNNMDDYAPIV
jgi:transcription initiation factor TFIID subunit 10